MGTSGPGREALGSRPGRCVCWRWGLGFWRPGGCQAGGVFASPSQTPQEVTPGHCGHSTPSPSESLQEQPVLSLKLQADPHFPSPHPALASNRWNPGPANGPVSTPLLRPGLPPQAWSALNLDLSVPLRPLKGEGVRGEGRRGAKGSSPRPCKGNSGPSREHGTWEASSRRGPASPVRDT